MQSSYIDTRIFMFYIVYNKQTLFAIIYALYIFAYRISVIDSAVLSYMLTTDCNSFAKVLCLKVLIHKIPQLRSTKIYCYVFIL